MVIGGKDPKVIGALNPCSTVPAVCWPDDIVEVGPFGNEFSLTAAAVAGVRDATPAPLSNSATNLTLLIAKVNAGFPIVFVTGIDGQAVSGANGIVTEFFSGVDAGVGGGTFLPVGVGVPKAECLLRVYS